MSAPSADTLLFIRWTPLYTLPSMEPERFFFFFCILSGSLQGPVLKGPGIFLFGRFRPHWFGPYVAVPWQVLPSDLNARKSFVQSGAPEGLVRIGQFRLPPHASLACFGFLWSGPL